MIVTMILINFVQNLIQKTISLETAMGNIVRIADKLRKVNSDTTLYEGEDETTDDEDYDIDELELGDDINEQDTGNDSDDDAHNAEGNNIENKKEKRNENGSERNSKDTNDKLQRLIDPASDHTHKQRDSSKDRRGTHKDIFRTVHQSTGKYDKLHKVSDKDLKCVQRTVSESKLLQQTKPMKERVVSLTLVETDAQHSDPQTTVQDAKVTRNKFGHFKKSKKRKLAQLPKNNTASVKNLLRESKNPKTQVAIDKERELRELEDMRLKSETHALSVLAEESNTAETEEKPTEEMRLPSAEEKTKDILPTNPILQRLNKAKKYDQLRRTKLAKHKQAMENFYKSYNDQVKRKTEYSRFKMQRGLSGILREPVNNSSRQEWTF